jgi:hypothetical protein
MGLVQPCSGTGFDEQRSFSGDDDELGCSGAGSSSSSVFHEQLGRSGSCSDWMGRSRSGCFFEWLVHCEYYGCDKHCGFQSLLQQQYECEYERECEPTAAATAALLIWKYGFFGSIQYECCGSLHYATPTIHAIPGTTN